MGKEHLSSEGQLSGGETLVIDLHGTHAMSVGSGEDDVELF